MSINVIIKKQIATTSMLTPFYNTQKQLIANNLTNYITKATSITNNEHVLNITSKTTFLQIIISQMCLELIMIIL